MTHVTEEQPKDIKKILVVEDDAGLLRLLQKTLTRRGYQTGGASTGAKAIEMLSDSSYDLLLLDYKLPDFTSHDLIARLRQASIDIPFIIVTGQGDQRTAVDMMKLGARDYLVKDHSLLDFLPAVVKQALEQTEVEQRYRRAQEALNESRERLDLALRSAGIGTWTWTIPEQSITWDHYIHPLFGLEPGTFSGKYEDFIELVHSEDRERVKQELHSCIESNKEYDTDYRVVSPDGSLRHLASKGKVYYNDEGEAVRITGVCLDVTESKLAEQEIRSLNEDLEARVAERTAQLEATNKELEAFSYSVSHDLRAPLRHVQGFANLLCESASETLDAANRRYVDIISQSAQRMGLLIDELLDFSRNGRLELRKRIVNLNDLIQESMRELQPATEERSIQWNIETLPKVRADRSMLRQVWLNLLSNAIKYTRSREQPVIEIGWSQNKQNNFEFFVKDNGVGFDMKYADKLFGVFQRLHRSKEFEGTGIGLANVRRIIHRHGGQTWGEGAVGQGATFYFSLPQSQPLNGGSK